MAQQGGFQALIYLPFLLHHMPEGSAVAAFLNKQINRFIRAMKTNNIEPVCQWHSKFFTQREGKKLRKKIRESQHHRIFLPCTKETNAKSMLLQH